MNGSHAIVVVVVVVVVVVDHDVVAGCSILYQYIYYRFHDERSQNSEQRYLTY
jgi:hypothetical protein